MYEFKGRHYLASLYGVKKIKHHELLKEVFTKAIEQSNGTICGYTEHIFNDGGMTGFSYSKNLIVRFIPTPNKKTFLWIFSRAGRGQIGEYLRTFCCAI